MITASSASLCVVAFVWCWGVCGLFVTMIIVVFVVFVVVVVVVIIKFKRGRKDLIPRSGLNPCIPVLPIFTLRIIAWSRQCSAFDAATAVPGIIRLVSWLEDCLARFFVVERLLEANSPRVADDLASAGEEWDDR